MPTVELPAFWQAFLELLFPRTLPLDLPAHLSLPLGWVATAALNNLSAARTTASMALLLLDALLLTSTFDPLKRLGL
jgi:hypothetical protein